MMKINDLPDSWEIIYPLVERFKISFQFSKSNWVFEKDVASNILFDYRNLNTLAFRGRLMSLLELRSPGSHRGLSSHRSLAYSICWDGFSFTKACFIFLFHQCRFHGDSTYLFF